jgi:autotransporter-associated beta strand protein
MEKNRISIQSQPGSFRTKKYFAFAGALLLSAAAALAQTLWIGGTADWNNAANWNPNTIPSGSVNCTDDNGSNNIILIQPGDPIFQHGDTLAGNADNTSGAWVQNGSTNNTGGGNWLRMGVGLGGVGYYTLLGNGVINVGGETHIGERGTGILEIDGGNYNAGVNGGNPGLCMGDADLSSDPSDNCEGTLLMTGGTITTDHEMWFGEANNGRVGKGHFIMHGGIINVNNWFVFGRFGGAGDGYMDGGTINKTVNGNVQFGVGTTAGPIGATSTFTQVGGTFHCASEYQISTDNPLTVATNNIGGNAVVVVDNWFAVGRNGGQGTLNLYGNASITKTAVNGGNVTLGGDNGGTPTGVINQTGGTFTNTATQTWIAENYLGTWNLSAGSAVLGVIHLTQNGGANGTFNLDGGDLTASEITDNGGSGTLNLNGGTLHAGGIPASPWIHNINGGVNVMAGGAKIDTAGLNVTISQALVDGGGGGLTKTGNGTLTFSGANTYFGPTLVNAGTLATTTDSTGAGNYTLADNTALCVTVLNAGAQLNMSNATLASSTAATLNIDVGAFGNPSASQAPVNVSGALAVNGTITINVADGLPQLGQFPLIKYGSRTGSGSFVLGSLPVGVTANLVDNTGNNSIDLNITGVNQPRWDGQAGGTWDTGADTNWVNIGTGLPTTYSDPSAVVFDDNALGTTTVNLTTTVNPNGVMMNNTALSYSISGSGKISGTTSLTKTGDGTLTIANTVGNNYTGATVISGGSLNVTSLADGGSPSAIGASSASPTNLVLSGGTLIYSGPTATINRGYSLQGVNTNSTIDTESSLTLSGEVTAGSGDGFSKTGPAQLAYTTVGSNSLSGANFEVQAGSLLLDGSAGGQTNNISGHLGINNAVGASVTLTNTTLNCGDFYIGSQANMTGSAEIDSGTTVNDNSWYILGDGANAVASTTMNGGTLNVPNGRLFLCSAPGTMAAFNMNGGTINKSGDYFAIVNGGWNGVGARTGVVNQVNGTINCQSECWVGDAGGAGNGSLGIYNLSGGALNLGSWFGVGRDGSTGIFNITGGTLYKAGNGDMVIGRGGSYGTFTVSGGAITKDAGNPIIVGQGQGVGEFDISGGTVNSDAEYWLGVDNGTIATNNISGTAQMNIHNWVTIGRNGLGVVNMSNGQFNSDTQPFIVGIWGGSQGVWNQSGGSLYVNQDIWIGQGDNNAYGVINLSGGTITNTGWIAVGREGAHGILNISGGTMVKAGVGNNISIAHNGGASGDVIISGRGTFICASGETWVGENAAPGTWTMNGGMAILGMVRLAENADATGVMTLNAGSLTATEITTGNTGASQRELDFNGGTLVAGADNANFIHDLSAAKVQSGGAIIDTAGHSVAVNQALLDDGGGLTKNGNGTLLLNGVNTYSGTTMVNTGTLGGNGTIAGSVLVSAGAAFSPGASIGTLTLGSTLYLAGTSTTVMEVNKTANTSDLVTGASTITFGGTLVLKNLSGALQVGDTFTLFSAGSYTGSFSSVVSQTPNQTVSWDLSQLSINGTVKVASAVAAPVRLAPVVSGGNLNLVWLADQIGWELQEQSNPLTIGISTNWVTVPGSTATNQVSLPVAAGSGSLFFRLVFPQQ